MLSKGSFLKEGGGNVSDELMDSPVKDNDEVKLCKYRRVKVTLHGSVSVFLGQYPGSDIVNSCLAHCKQNL